MRQNSFTLVEIMVTVAVIALLAALSIPNLLRARLQANESVAIAALRTISTAMESYRVSNMDYNGASLLGLSSASPPYIDSILGSGVKQGYNFTLTVVDAHQYWIAAQPVTAGITGNRNFYIDEQGVVCGADIPAADHAAVTDACPSGFNPIQ